MSVSHRYRSVFISDVHLGTPDCKTDYLLDFLRRVRCDQLYLVGDIIDLQALARRRGWQRKHSAVLMEILDIAQRGTQVTYIPGNHDAALRDFAGLDVGGVKVVLDAVHETADGRRFRVSHGDAYDPEHGCERGWQFLGEHLHRLICWGNRCLHAIRQRLHKPYLPLSIIIKSRIVKARRYIRDYESRVAAAARESGHDGHICGHIHFGRIRNVDGVLYLNDGDWVEHCTALVEEHTGAMELLHWSEHCTQLGRASSETVLPSHADALAFTPLQAMQRDLSNLQVTTDHSR